MLSSALSKPRRQRDARPRRSFPDQRTIVLVEGDFARERRGGLLELILHPARPRSLQIQRQQHRQGDSDEDVEPVTVGLDEAAEHDLFRISCA